MKWAYSIEDFAAARSRRLEESDAELEAVVKEALAAWPADGWLEPIIVGASVLFLEIFEAEGGENGERALAGFQRDLRETLELTKNGNPDDGPQVDRIAKWVSVYSANAGTFFASFFGGERRKMWVTMGDDDVRDTHVRANGQIAPIAGTFDVGGFNLRFPGDPVGPPEVWINCRCLLAASPRGDSSMDPETFEMDADLAEREPDDLMESLDGEALVDDLAPIPWHAVLAPEGVPTGDGRMFAKDALTWRETPLPLLYQRVSTEGHGNSVVVGRIDRIWKEDGIAYGAGVFNPSVPETAEVVDGIIFGTIRGLSIDADDIEVEINENDVETSLIEALTGQQTTVFSRSRISGATLVAIPAFKEAYIELGEEFGAVDPIDEEAEEAEGALVASAAPEGAREEAKRGLKWVEEGHAGDGLEPATVERARKIAAGADLTDEHIKRMHSFFSRHETNKGTTGWSPGEDGYPSPGRVAWALWGGDAGQSFAAAEVKRMERESSLRASAFAPGTKDGPGWLTHPRETARIRRYWVRGKGAAKIRWGTPGAFNRCRRQMAKYVSPVFLAGTCANMYKEATGRWPGVKRGDKGLAVDSQAFMSLVAAGAPALVPAEHFRDPKLTAPTALTVTEDGRIYGHLAAWGVCHLGFSGVCRTAPRSATNYSYFRLGFVDTDEGPVPVGQITLGTGHAGPDANSVQALAHYDNTGTAVADVAAGEDAHGIWISGRIRDTASEADIHALKAAKLSGDWRAVGGNLELVAALAVNVPGFPVPRTSLAASAGQQTSLVAAGIIAEPEVGPVELDMSTLVAAVVDEIDARAARQQRLAAARQVAAELDELVAQRRSRRVAAARARVEAEVGV